MNGKICLVTGGTNGIGKATAQALAQMGATDMIEICIAAPPSGGGKHSPGVGCGQSVNTL